MLRRLTPRFTLPKNYFRKYHKLPVWSGTAETEAGWKFWEIYKLDVVCDPTNRVISVNDRRIKFSKTVREKLNAVVDEINEISSTWATSLGGTTSVEISEVLSPNVDVEKGSRIRYWMQASMLEKQTWRGSRSKRYSLDCHYMAGRGYRYHTFRQNLRVWWVWLSSVLSVTKSRRVDRS